MIIKIINPVGSPILAGEDQRIYLESNMAADWDDGSSTFATNTKTAAYTTGTVVNADGNGNPGVDLITITATDPVTLRTSSIQIDLVAGMPTINCEMPEGSFTSEFVPVDTRPGYTHANGGTADAPWPVDWSPVDEDNQNPEAESCTVLDIAHPHRESHKCTCGGAEAAPAPGGGQGGSSKVATLFGGSQGILQPEGTLCPLHTTAADGCNRISTELSGKLQVKTGCGIIPTYLGKLDLGVYYSSAADNRAPGEQIAGPGRSFGWEARLIEDTAGNAAIYWGDRRVTGFDGDGMGNFSTPKGNFSTLVKSDFGDYTLTTKDGMYYDFDSNGRLSTIKDRSPYGHTVYYDYNGSNQMTKIKGDSLGAWVYFTYDGSGHVNKMNVEPNPSGTAYAIRTTYYDYDLNGQMNVIEGPESCITYFDYAGPMFLLNKVIDPDNYRTYFEYTTDSGPRVKTVDLSEGAAVYYAYDDNTPWTSREEKGSPPQYFEYEWGGKPAKASWAGNVLPTYFEYDENAKPILSKGTDVEVSYYQWDSTGQLTWKYRAGSSSAPTYYTYGAVGTVTSKKDALGRVTYWNYDANNLQINWIDALGNTTYFERDGGGGVSEIKDRRGNVTMYSVDFRGYSPSFGWPDFSNRSYESNSTGEIISVTDEANNTAYYDRDLRGRITKWKDFLGTATQYVYDNRGNRTIEIDRRGNAWYWEYDGLSRNITRRTALLNTTYLNYDGRNLLENTVDPRGNPTYFYYTDQKRLLATENALQEIIYYEYTDAGQLESIRDPRGASQYFTYDSHHRKTSEKDGVGNVTYFDYDAVGNPEITIDPRGYAVYHSYDDLNRLTFTLKPVDPDGERNYFYYDVESNLIADEDAFQRRNYFYYDSRNRQDIVEDVQKNRTYFTYDNRSNRDSQKDALGNVTYFYPDALSRQFAVRDALDNLSYLEFDAESNQIASKDERSNATYFEYDIDNQETQVKDPLGNMTTTTYDSAGNATSIVDARNNPSYFYFDDLSRQFCTEDAKQARTYFEFDLSGNRESVKDPLSRTTYYEYDDAQKNTEIKDPLGNVTTFGYDASGNQHLVTDARSKTTYFNHDGQSRMVLEKDPFGAETTHTYDDVGDLTVSAFPMSRSTSFTYDSLHRLEATTDTAGKSTYFTYDAVGNQVSIKDPRSNSQYFTYDVLNRRNSLKTETADVWYFDYDPVSNLKHQINSRAAITYWEYTARNEKESQKDPLGRTWYWEYDAVGNNTSIKDGKANETTYNFDVVNLNDQVDHADSTIHYFEYNDAREQVAMADPTGRTEWTYDKGSRPTIRLNPGNQALYFGYDAVGNRTELKDQDGTQIYYEYDDANRIDIISSGAYGGNIAYYEYNLAGDMVHETRKNGVLTYHAYDSVGRVSHIKHHTTPIVVNILSDTFTRDENGNIIKNSQVDGVSTRFIYWNYDEANRITKEAWRSQFTIFYGWLYDYDEAGNRTYKQDTVKSTTTYWEYDLGDQLTRQRSGTPVDVYFEFDDNGNLSVEHDVTAGRTYYDYDDRNLLTRVDFPAGGPATNYFEHNALVERVRKDDSTGGKKYTWDGLDVVVEKDLTDTTNQRLVKGYTPVAGIGAYVLQDVSGIEIFAHKNQVGTTQKTTDGTGSVDSTYELDAWGVELSVSELTGQQYRFTGKESLVDVIPSKEAGAMYHFFMRDYRAGSCQFFQADPIFGLPEGVNRISGTEWPVYQYAGNSPTSVVDPMGLMGKLCRGKRPRKVRLAWTDSTTASTSSRIPEHLMREFAKDWCIEVCGSLSCDPGHACAYKGYNYDKLNHSATSVTSYWLKKNKPHLLSGDKRQGFGHVADFRMLCKCDCVCMISGMPESLPGEIRPGRRDADRERPYEPPKRPGGLIGLLGDVLIGLDRWITERGISNEDQAKFIMKLLFSAWWNPVPSPASLLRKLITLPARTGINGIRLGRSMQPNERE